MEMDASAASPTQTDEAAAISDRPATREQLLIGILTVLTYRMGGRVRLARGENKRTIEHLTKQLKKLEIRATDTEVILELVRIIEYKPATAQTGDKIQP